MSNSVVIAIVAMLVVGQAVVVIVADIRQATELSACRAQLEQTNDDLPF